MNNEKFEDFLLDCIGYKQENGAFVASIICEEKEFPILLDRSHADFLPVRFESGDCQRKLADYLRIRDEYHNFSFVIGEGISEAELDLISETIKKQEKVDGIKLLVFTSSEKYDKLKLFNQSRMTCRLTK